MRIILTLLSVSLISACGHENPIQQGITHANLPQCFYSNSCPGDANDPNRGAGAAGTFGSPPTPVTKPCIPTWIPEINRYVCEEQ